MHINEPVFIAISQEVCIAVHRAAFIFLLRGTVWIIHHWSTGAGYDV